MIGTISEELERACNDLQRCAPNYQAPLERFALRLQEAWIAGEQREVAGMADLVAFWAYQAKWYYARANGLGCYDDLPVAKQKAIDATFEQHRIAENRERIGHVEPARDIGT